MKKYVMEIVMDFMMPVGYIYIQLPHAKPPQEVWPGLNLEWKNISPNYSDVFFRVEGNKTAHFGQLQGDTSPRLKAVKYEWMDEMQSRPDHITIQANGQMSSPLYTGRGVLNVNWWNTLKFQVSSDEVRPRNMAIRIWERIK